MVLFFFSLVESFMTKLLKFNKKKKKYCLGENKFDFDDLEYRS